MALLENNVCVVISRLQGSWLFNQPLSLVDILVALSPDVEGFTEVANLAAFVDRGDLALVASYHRRTFNLWPPPPEQFHVSQVHRNLIHRRELFALYLFHAK
jgi:hypothetical protein